MPGGRFFGFVIGGTHPAALAADWLVSAWDQNCGLRGMTPAHTAVEDIATAWLLDLLGLPAGCAIGFVTGATMANFTGLAAGRDAVLRRAGWDVARDGLSGGPRVRVLVGAERHDTIDLALRYLGLGAPEPVRGRRPGPVARRRPATPAGDRPRRDRRSCCSRPATCTPAPSTPSPRRSRSRTATAPGCTSTAPSGSGRRPRPAHRHLVAGHEAADSWATDAHKTLNVPYDCGPRGRARPGGPACGDGHARRLPDPRARGPARAVRQGAGAVAPRTRLPGLGGAPRRSAAPGSPTWSTGLCRHATRFAEGLADLGATVLNDVVFTQVCADFGDDDRTDAVIDGLLADGTTWMTGSTWHGRRVLRISVSNWSTTDDDVTRSLEAVRRALAATR